MRASLALILLSLAMACGGESEEAGPIAAALSDPGFEEGGEAWGYVGEYKLGLFRVSEAYAHSGTHSGHLFLDSRAVPPLMTVRAASGVQELAPEAFPETLSGWYRVEKWQAEAPETGLFVNILVYVMGDPRTMEIVRPDDPNAGPPPAQYPGYAVSYRLAGDLSATQELVEAQEESWGNVGTRDLGVGAPRAGEWVRFELPLRADFEEIWGVVPSGYGSLRIILQTLWMDRPAGSEVMADVYFDDLELTVGGQSG